MTTQEKAQCVSWFIEMKSDIQTQRNYATKCAKRVLARQSICNWHKQFMEMETLPHKPSSGRPRTSEEGIECNGQSFSHSQTKSICTAYSYMKDVVYRTKVKNISDLKERITVAVETINEEMLRRTMLKLNIV